MLKAVSNGYHFMLRLKIFNSHILAFRFLGAQWLATVFVALVSFFVSILIARALGPDQFGVYSIALSMGAILAILIDGGFGSLLQRERALVSEPIAELLPKLPGLAYGHALSVIIVLSLLVVLILPAKAHTLIAAIWFFGMAVLNQFGLAILRGDGRLVRDASWQIGNRSLTAIFVLIAVLLMGATQPWQIFGAQLLGGVVFGGFVIRYLRVRPIICTLSKPYRLVLPFIWLNLASVLYFRADMVLLGWFKIPRIDIGHYGVAYRLMEAVILFASPISVMLFRKFRLSSFSPRETIKKMLPIFFVASIMGCSMFFAFYVSGHYVITLAYGNEYADAAKLLIILGFSLVFILPNGVLNQVALALNLERWLAISATVAAVVNVGGNVILIPNYGPTGAAWMTVITEALLCVLTGVGVSRRWHIT